MLKIQNDSYHEKGFDSFVILFLYAICTGHLQRHTGKIIDLF